MYGVQRIACLIAVVATATAATAAVAAAATATTTTVQQFIDSTTRGAPLATVAPLAQAARSGKALSAPVNMARMWPHGGGGGNTWRMVPSRHLSWDADSRIPMNQESANSISRIGRVDLDDEIEEGREKNKYYKKYKKYMLPLLLAYKLKFFTLVPILIGGLVLLTGATGLAGFFFALFAATMGLKGGGEH